MDEASLRDVQSEEGARRSRRHSGQPPGPQGSRLTTDDVGAVLFLAPWLICALLAWCMWWYWQRLKRK